MSKESIYDEKIDPLMTQIIEICKKNKIPIICSFALDDRLQASTIITDTEYIEFEDIIVENRFLKASTILHGSSDVNI